MKFKKFNQLECCASGVGFLQMRGIAGAGQMCLPPSVKRLAVDFWYNYFPQCAMFFLFCLSLS